MRASKPAHLSAGGRGPTVVGDRGARDHDVAHHRRRRRHLVGLELVGRDAEPAPQVDHALLPEAGAGPAGGGVEGDQTRVDGGHEDPPRARRARRRAAVAPVGDTAAREVAVPTLRVDAGSYRQRSRPVAGSSAIARPRGVLTNIVPSTTSGVASRAGGRPRLTTTSASPVW